jgi:hypothetical protein
MTGLPKARCRRGLRAANVNLQARNGSCTTASIAFLETAVAVVGDRERVIAGTDCGFGTFAGWEWVAEDVVREKLKTLRKGANIATARLWEKKAA